jgi:ADP-ribose pyrophosphatase
MRKTGSIVLTTRKFNVEHRTYEVKGRGTIERDLVVHLGAVLIVPVLDAERVVMIRNYRYTVEEELIEFPAGTLDAPGETPADCAARELEEETGYRAGRVEAMGSYYTSPGISTEIMHCFVATDLEKRAQRLEPTEVIEPEIVRLDTAVAWVADGKIRDGKTIAALLRYYYQVRRH